VRLLTRIVVVACAAAASLSAQQPQQPVFRSGVELVTIDVVATGRDGRPVHDLKAGDFELLEDGKPQEIRAFQFINFSTAPSDAPPPPGIITNDVEPGGVFALVLDEIGSYATEVRDVRRAAERFLTGALQPHDHVAVVRAGANSGFFLTADRTMAIEAALSSTGRRDRGVRLEQAGAVDAVGAGDFDTASPGTLGRNSFTVLEAVIERLRPIPARRKAIVWISRGGEMPANFEMALEIGQPIGRNEDALRRLIDRARLANVAIYTVDPRGLVAPSTSGSGNPGAQDFADVGTHRDLANATGGRAIVNANDIDSALQRMAVENRAYYLLGYEPASPGHEKKPKARRIRVTTKSPGVELLHRSMYLPGMESRFITPSVLESPLPIRDLQIKLAPASVAIDRAKRGIVVPFEIGADLADNTDVEYTAMALDAEGRVVSRANGRGRARNGRVTGEVKLAAGSKSYQVRFAAQAKSPEVNGVVFATVRVPEGNTKEAVCGGFVFEQPGRPGMRELTRDQPVTISSLISAEGLDGTVAPLAFALGPAGGIPQRTWPVQLAIPLSKGLYRVALTLRPPLPRGHLEIQLLRNGLLMHDDCIAQFSSQ
jgi:VWFA-related protein